MEDLIPQTTCIIILKNHPKGTKWTKRKLPETTRSHEYKHGDWRHCSVSCSRLNPARYKLWQISALEETVWRSLNNAYGILFLFLLNHILWQSAFYSLPTLSVILPWPLLQSWHFAAAFHTKYNPVFSPNWTVIPESRNTCNHASWSRTSVFCNCVKSLL